MTSMHNTSFSSKLEAPGGLFPLQLAIDSTSLKAYKHCPRFYYYGILLGWQPRAESVHLTFGLLLHGSVERYYHGKAQGRNHDDSVDMSLDWALKQTWDKALSRPWLSGDSYKNRLTLVRTLVGYLDKYGDNDALQTVVLANGKPAVELSFSFDFGITSDLTGEPILGCGHLDRLATLNDVPYIPDLKTTKYDLGPIFWNQFSPSTQFGMYQLAGEIVYKLPCKGIIVDGVQVLVGQSRYDRHLITKDRLQMEEFFKSTIRWIGKMENSAAALADGTGEAAYEMNEESCHKYNGCDFRSICQRSPGSRQTWLEAGFKKRVWDPLQRRGDI